MRLREADISDQYYIGKILADDKAVESLNFKEGKDFMVVMVSKVQLYTDISCREEQRAKL